jgi:hypothetical protein
VGTALLGVSGASGAVPAQISHALADGPNEAVAGTSVAALNGGLKPVYVAPAQSRDPVAHSVADTLFWGDIMMEHAQFFVMLMPGDDLAEPRNRAAHFQRSFADHLARLRQARLTADTYQAFNRATIDLVKPYAEYKRFMSEAQSSGRYRTLVWTTFFDHTLHEAERFARRLAQLNQGSTEYDRQEVVPFWAQIMDEHALFIAHLLDPVEETLIAKANQTSETFRRIRGHAPSRAGGNGQVLAAVDSIIDFKTAATKGIQAGKIKSIIAPSLADHVRREAVRFRDELTRT